jgi:hypothetical protein
MAGVRGPRPGNEEIAAALERVADLLEVQRASAWRVRAYRSAGASVRAAAEPLHGVVEREGRAGLERLPAVGRSIAALIDELVRTGRLGLLERLEGEVSPEDLFTSVPGIGDELARRIHRELGVETLEELELAAHDGRLAGVAGFGPRRIQALRHALAGLLGRSARRRARRQRWLEGARPGQERAAAGAADAQRPSLEALLALDAEYRRRAEAGELHLITPRRFNPEQRAWLPVLHAEREGFALTALFSNTARAHELGATRDWVVIYYERDGDEGQCTVVTERRGPLAGRRVVRGRERECAARYGLAPPAAAPAASAHERS